MANIMGENTDPYTYINKYILIYTSIVLLII